MKAPELWYFRVYALVCVGPGAQGRVGLLLGGNIQRCQCYDHSVFFFASLCGLPTHPMT